jgi:hypothetical protein
MKSMEIASFKFKSCNLPVLTFNNSDLNILSYKSQFDAESIVLDSWLKDLSTYQVTKFQPKKISYERDMIFLRWQMNSASKQVLWRNEFKLRSEASKPTSKLLFQQFSSYKSKLEYFMQGYFFFLRKIIIEVLKYKLSTWRTIL